MTQITIKTNVSPEFSFDPTHQTAGSLRAHLLRLIQPSIDLNLPIVGEYHFAPYGEPSGIGLAILFLVVALAFYGLYKILA